jgi:hypothetical protein
MRATKIGSDLTDGLAQATSPIEHGSSAQAELVTRPAYKQSKLRARARIVSACAVC